MLNNKKIYVALRLIFGLSYGLLNCHTSSATEPNEDKENISPTPLNSSPFSPDDSNKRHKPLRTITNEGSSSFYSPISPTKRALLKQDKENSPTSLNSLLSSPYDPNKRQKPLRTITNEGSSSLDSPPISPTKRAILKKEKIPLLIQYEMAFLAKSLVEEESKNPKTFFDGKTWRHYKQLGGDSPELNRKRRCLKTEVPKRIKNPSCKILTPKGKNVSTFLSPVARQFPREIFSRTSRRKELFPHTPANAFTEEEREETPEEKNERKVIARNIFLKMEETRGLSPQLLSSSLEEEKAAWKIFWQYFDIRKEAFSSHPKACKISRKEIEEIFEENVAEFYQKIIVDKYTLYFDSDLIDLERQDDKERTNCMRMENLLCPIGPDGKEMNFHHLTHHDPGIIVLLSDTIHESESGKFHFPKSCYVRPKPVDRRSFNEARKNMINALLKQLTPSNILTNND